MEREPEPGFREAFADAMRKTGLGQVAPGEVPTAGSLLAAVGGARGLVESILPGLGFLVIYTLTRGLPEYSRLLFSVLTPVALAVIFIIVRLATRTPLTQALAGVFGIVLSAFLAVVSRSAEGNFIPGIFINISSLIVLLGSIAIRWPLIGVVVGFLTNEGTAWRRDVAKRRVLFLATWLWAALFALRLAVEVPLFLAKQVELLGVAKLVLGVPLYAALLWVTWLLVRAVYGRLSTERPDTPD